MEGVEGGGGGRGRGDQFEKSPAFLGLTVMQRWTFYIKVFYCFNENIENNYQKANPLLLKPISKLLR